MRILWTTTNLASLYSFSSVKLRWCLVLKHRQNVGKPSFHKLTRKLPAEDTLRTAFSKVHCICCESVSLL